MRFRNRYGLLDRLLHRVAFATVTAQGGAADLERRLYRRELEQVELDAPVLITALPRAGTTVLLELIAGSPEFASQTYRHMPFVLCPMLWSRISRPFRRADEPRERAHGDGIEVSLDSPESFEEVVWKLHWPKHYRGSTIAPWESCEGAEFLEFLTTHMRKVVACARRENPAARRYVSKNNLNIARLPAVLEAVPSAIALVLFRDPLQQAASLLAQHRRFTALHREDKFARRYMAAIGHYDFGANLKPVDFGGWYGDGKGRDPDRLEFWLDYWLATYRHLHRHAEHQRLHLIGFEALCAAADLGPLTARLGITDAPNAARELRVPKPHDVDETKLPADTLAEARELHERLRELSIL